MHTPAYHTTGGLEGLALAGAASALLLPLLPPLLHPAYSLLPLLLLLLLLLLPPLLLLLLSMLLSLLGSALLPFLPTPSRLDRFGHPYLCNQLIMPFKS